MADADKAADGRGAKREGDGRARGTEKERLFQGKLPESESDREKGVEDSEEEEDGDRYPEASRAAKRARSEQWRREGNGVEFSKEGGERHGSAGLDRGASASRRGPKMRLQQAKAEEGWDFEEFRAKLALLLPHVPKFSEALSSNYAVREGDPGALHRNQDAEVGQATFATIIMEKSDIQSSHDNDENSAVLVDALLNMGLLKQQITKESGALESAVNATVDKLIEAARTIGRASMEERWSRREGHMLHAIERMLTTEAHAVRQIHRYHTDFIVEQMRFGQTENQAHRASVDLMRVRYRTVSRGLATPPTSFHGGTLGALRAPNQMPPPRMTLAAQALAAQQQGGQLMQFGGQLPQFGGQSLQIGQVPPPPTVKPPTPRQRGVCHNCEMPGHHIKDCPQPKPCKACRQMGHEQGDSVCPKK